MACYSALRTLTNDSLNAVDLLPNGEESSTCTPNVDDLLSSFSLNSFSSGILTRCYPVSLNADALLKMLLESSLPLTSLLDVYNEHAQKRRKGIFSHAVKD
ncbi:uncharacterized protein LOC141617948 isoform X2 [Silene latifolia]|uniref:uncharacterized protein LOC141617948 isoform X2 n=1 Tax=Silene latifolia TaxID=37657 RepID=UPI003D770598